MKVAGSKENLADEILPVLMSFITTYNIKTYVEPFVGGANIIDKVQAEKKIGYDIDKYIIALFKYIQNGGEIPEGITKEQFNDAKAQYESKKKTYDDWYIGLLGYLGGNGKKIYGQRKLGMTTEEFNDKYIESRNDLLHQLKFLGDIEFKTADYKELDFKGALIYCDPPYSGKVGIDGTAKTINYREFWDKVREWSKENIVIVSEEQAPDDFDIIWEQENSSEETNRNKRKTEKLFILRELNKNSGEDEFSF